MQQNNFYLLKKLAPELQQKLMGMALATCFTQNKDEIVLGFCNPEQELYIKAALQPDISCLCFLNDFQRAKKNTVELFKDALDSNVLDVKVVENDRCFCIYLENNFVFVFKMYGNRANLILFENNEINEVFNKNLKGDFALRLENLGKSLDFSFEVFEQNDFQPKKLLPTLDKPCLEYLQQQGFQQADATKKWHILQKMRETLENPVFYLDTNAALPILSILPISIPTHTHTTAIEALNEFYFSILKVNSLDKEKAHTSRLLEKRISQTQQYLLKTTEKLTELEQGGNHEHIGHLIMANLHQIPSKAEEITLTDFYTEKPVKIKLKFELSPQKNAENYYRKGKNQKTEIQKLYENLELKEIHLQTLKSSLEALKNIETLRDLRKYIKDNAKIIDEKPENIFPFKRYNFEDFVVWVGRNAQNNDLLTQKYTYKEDLWLHAKDVSGSHVVIKHQSGKVFPKTVIEKAAQLAAFYSKRKNDSLCPVIFTPKKYVRKTKDLAFGQVIVEREQVLMVEPKDFR